MHFFTLTVIDSLEGLLIGNLFARREPYVIFSNNDQERNITISYAPGTSSGEVEMKGVLTFAT
jgi:hypothetical protein